MEKNVPPKKDLPLAVVIMAAGKGTRMKDPSKAKVMYEVLGRPMIHYVVELANMLGAVRSIAIVGYQREAVVAYLQRAHPNVEIAVQAEQLGTGHAVMQAETALSGLPCQVVVLSGDVPLLTAQTMEELIKVHQQSESAATILTAEFPDPTGYGRIVRKADGSVARIVEHKDATEDERRITEINSGIYIFDRPKLFEALKSITPQNVQKEYYLTDVFECFRRNDWRVSAVRTSHREEILGINTVDQLEDVKRVLLARQS